eukprot:19124-Heterococcus_DN1.PRE.2
MSCCTCIHVRPAAVVSSELATTSIGSLLVEVPELDCEYHVCVSPLKPVSNAPKKTQQQWQQKDCVLSVAHPE